VNEAAVETPELTKPIPQTQPQMTKEELAGRVIEMQLGALKDSDRNERILIGRRKAANGCRGFEVFSNPSIELTLEELMVLIPLKRDALNYEWENKAKGTHGVLAKNAQGFLAMGKAKGRRKPHMSGRKQEVKSESLHFFRSLFASHTEKLVAVCKEEKIEYLGMPDAVLPELRAKALRLAVRLVNAKRRLKRRQSRRRKDFSRRVNAGLITISTNESKFVNRGSQYGSY
jgi:hypothetical protein